LEAISQKFNLGKPVVIADSGLLSDKNIIVLESEGYEYIIGARLKNESRAIQERILEKEYQDDAFHVIAKDEDRRLIVHYSTKRAGKVYIIAKKVLTGLKSVLNQAKCPSQISITEDITSTCSWKAK
jgi:hypothetical protein